MQTLDEVGIPGSERATLFYQSNRWLPEVDRGEGVLIWDRDGNRYLDGCSGACAANIGHGNKRILAKAKQQLERIAFAYRTQFESEAANELANLLVHLSPEGLDRVFLVNSGSEAVEAAFKLARQYWWSSCASPEHRSLWHRHPDRPL